MEDQAAIAVLGAGSWGTALAVHCARVGHDVRLWGRDASLMDEIARARENAALPARTSRVGSRARRPSSLEAALDGAPIVDRGRAVARHARACCDARAPRRSPRTRSWSARRRGSRPSRSTADVAGDRRGGWRGHPVAVLSGPSFALEVARGLPTAVVVASTDAAAATRVQESSRARRSGSTAATTWRAWSSAAR